MKKTILLSLCLCLYLVSQAQVSKNLNITVEGTLSSLLSSTEKNTVTDLTLIGNIDARDFKTMRDDMPLLAVLDLSEVRINEYTGTEGTFDTNNKDYPANTIPARAFYDSKIYSGKTNFELILLPHSITAVGEYAFHNLTKLKTISIPSSVTSVGDLAFCGTSGLIDVQAENPNFSSVDGVLFNKLKTTLIQCPISIAGNYSIPNSVTSIGIFAFDNCSKLTSIYIPPFVTSIGNCAFVSCKGLTSVNIPSSVTKIGYQAFFICSGLNSVTIPSSVITIDWWAFAGSSGLIDVDSNNPNYSSLYGILYNKEKTKLIQCPISKSGSFAVSSSVNVIGEASFWNCSKLTSITIPSTVTSIERNAFWTCRGLSSLYIYQAIPIDLSHSSSVFVNVNKSTCKLYVPAGSASEYRQANQWSDFENIVEMPEFKLSADVIKIEAAQGSSASVDITSDVAWKASSDQSWLTVSPGSGSGNGKLTFTAAANTSNTIRKATVTVSATGVESRTISVVQSYTLQSKITKLYDFDCQYPYTITYNSRLVFDGTFLYGIVQDLSFSNGTCKLLRIKPDGSDFEILYSFDFGGDVYLTLSNSVLYGVVSNYLDNQNFVFKINSDGTNYTKLFFPENNNSEPEYSPLIVAGNLIYGTTNEKNTNNKSIYKVNTDGSGYSVIYSFSTSYTLQALYLSNNTIIGLNDFKLFKINTDGSGYYNFNIDARTITVQNNTIYGIENAYPQSDGYIFKVNIDGTGFEILRTTIYPELNRSFSGSLSIVGNQLYGNTFRETDGKMEIFKINLDGSSFIPNIDDKQTNEVIYSAGELAIVGNDLIGFGSSEILGNIFKINTLNDTFSEIFKFGVSTSGVIPMGTLVESDDFLYGNTMAGGSNDMGTIFRIKKDGSGYTKLFEFNGSETGASPNGQLTMVGDFLYGTTFGGFEQTENGTIFKINLDGTGYVNLHDFDGTNGAGPNGSLVYHKEILYGITSAGGTENHGVIFKINPDGTGFTKISDNTDLDTGENPYNGITISDDDVIYGVSAVDYGGVFRVNTDGTGLKKIFEMNDVSGDFSYCKPLLNGAELYITTSEGGEYGVGTIFKIKTDGTGLTVLYDFIGIDDDLLGSGFRNNSLVYHNGALYGTATGNGINDHGYLYKINLDGSGFTKLSDFNGEFGSVPYLCDLIIDQSNTIYGMTTLGGLYNGGIIYKYSLDETPSSVFMVPEKIQFQIYPNPAKDFFRISGLREKSTLWLYNLNGELILTKEVKNNETISVKSLPEGVYLININSNTKNFVGKLIKE